MIYLSHLDHEHRTNTYRRRSASSSARGASVRKWRLYSNNDRALPQSINFSFLSLTRSFAHAAVLCFEIELIEFDAFNYPEATDRNAGIIAFLYHTSINKAVSKTHAVSQPTSLVVLGPLTGPAASSPSEPEPSSFAHHNLTTLRSAPTFLMKLLRHTKSNDLIPQLEESQVVLGTRRSDDCNGVDILLDDCYSLLLFLASTDITGYLATSKLAMRLTQNPTRHNRAFALLRWRPSPSRLVANNKYRCRH